MYGADDLSSMAIFSGVWGSALRLPYAGETFDMFFGGSCSTLRRLGRFRLGDGWGRNWLKPYHRRLIDYYLVMADRNEI
jgi:hypothetical protein